LGLWDFGRERMRELGIRFSQRLTGIIKIMKKTKRRGEG
jgi:ribosomal protein L17